MIRPILLDILGPILLLVLLGALVRHKFKVDVGTLSKPNLYLFVPAFLFDQVSRSTLGWGQMGGVVAVTVLHVITLGLLVWGVGRALNVGPRTLATVAIAVMFYNSGNYGLPLAELAYPGAAAGRDGPAVQAFVVFCQSLLTFTVGLMIAARAGGGDLKSSLGSLLRLPTLYVLTAALLARGWVQAGHELPKLITVTTDFLSRGLVPVALVTLGAQLAVAPRWPRWKPVSMVLALRLLFGHVQMAVLLFGLSRIARPMDWTTVFSCVTITAWLVVIRLAMPVLPA